MTSSHVRAYWRESRAKQRERAKESGFCTIWLSRGARKGMATCPQYSDAATKRTAEPREQAKR